MELIGGAARLMVEPPLLLVVVALGGLLLGLRWRRLGRAVTWGALCLLYMLSTPFVGSRLLASQQTEPAFDPAAGIAGAGAIVVLSADIAPFQPDYGGETVAALTLERLRRGARLHRETGLPILVSGGVMPERDRSLADVMAEALTEDFRVPVRWLEGASYTTAENAFYSAQTLRAEGIRKVLLVTSAWHMPRSLLAFRAFGLDPVPVPTGFVVPTNWRLPSWLPSGRSLQQSQWALHEMIGRAYYTYKAWASGRGVNL